MVNHAFEEVTECMCLGNIDISAIRIDQNVDGELTFILFLIIIIIINYNRFIHDNGNKWRDFK